MDAATTTFELLSHLGSQPGMRVAKDARPIVFEMLPSREVRWRFNPANPSQLFSPGDIADAPLRIRCEPTLLLRLVAERNFTLKPQDAFEHEGDLNLLTHLAATLRRPASSLFSTEEQ
jgi:hypothetical protein